MKHLAKIKIKAYAMQNHFLKVEKLECLEDYKFEFIAF